MCQCTKEKEKQIKEAGRGPNFLELESFGHLQPISVRLNGIIRNDVVACDNPGERDAERGPGPHVGGMSGDPANGVSGIVAETVLE